MKSDHLAAELAELLETAAVEIREPVVVEAEEAKQRDMYAGKVSAALTSGGVHELGLLSVSAKTSELVFTLEKTAGVETGVPHFWNIVLLSATPGS
jgi:hypothetical protein